MAFVRTLLRPVARVAGMNAERQLRRFLDAHRRTQQVQEDLLRRLIDSAAQTDFGRDHHFDRIRSVADFRSAVPVGDYEDRRPYLQRVFEGRSEALLPASSKLLMFAVTSGTTGRPKHIPVTGPFLEDYRRGWNIFGVRLLSDHRDGWLRPIVTITSSAREETSPAGVPCGSISGMLAETQKWIVRRMYPVPSAVAEIHEPADKYYAVVRSSIAQDVGLVTTANPSSLVRLAQAARDNAERIVRDVRDGTLRLPGGPLGRLGEQFAFRPAPRAARRLEEILRRHGELLPRHFWKPCCLAVWTGGTVGLYLPRLRELYGPTPIRDIGLLASEGRMSIPLEDGTPAGVAEITSNFLEFIPAEQVEAAVPDVLAAHEVAVGAEYSIVLSNRSGLWRYHIGDRVRVVGRLGQSPVIEFLARGLHTSSITGEKLTEDQVVEAMRGLGGGGGPRIELFTLQGRFAETPYYELRVEQPPGEAASASALADRLDVALRRLNVEYEAKRASGRLGPIRAAPLPCGTLAGQEERLIRGRRGRAEQYKHRYLLDQVIPDCPAPPTGS